MPDQPTDPPPPAHLVLDPVVRALIRAKAHRLVRARAVRRQDAADLEQDLVLAVLVRLPAFDPARGPLGGFVRTVVDRQAANLLRDRHAARRDPGRTTPLAGDVDAPGRPDDLGLDLADVLARLPPDQRALVEALRLGTVAAAARHLGVPRTTLTDALRVLSRRLDHTGLREYLGKPPVTSPADRVIPLGRGRAPDLEDAR